MNRRTFLERTGAAAAGPSLLIHRGSRAWERITIDPTPRFEISPYL